MSSIKDVAREAEVSIGTVDRVLHNRGRVSAETTARIEEVMKKLDYKPNHVAQGLAVNKKKLNLCFIVVDSQRNPFFADVRKAAEKRAEKLKQYGVNVDICMMNPDLHSDGYLTEKLKKAVKEVDGIATIGLNSKKSLDILREENERNIPIVFYNCKVSDVNYLAFVGCNYVDSGKLAAGIAVLLGGKNARVGVFSQGVEGIEKIASYEERMLGFHEEIRSRYPDMQIVGTKDIEKSQDENEKMVREMLRDHPDMNIAYIVNPADYKICEIIHRLDTEQRVRIITNDLVGRQIEMVKNEIIAATICQEPEKQGEMPLDILFQYLAYGTKPRKKDIYTKLSIHIAQNIY